MTNNTNAINMSVIYMYMPRCYTLKLCPNASQPDLEDVVVVDVADPDLVGSQRGACGNQGQQEGSAAFLRRVDLGGQGGGGAGQG